MSKSWVERIPYESMPILFVISRKLYRLPGSVHHWLRARAKDHLGLHRGAAHHRLPADLQVSYWKIFNSGKKWKLTTCPSKLLTSTWTTCLTKPKTWTNLRTTMFPRSPSRNHILNTVLSPLLSSPWCSLHIKFPYNSLHYRSLCYRLWYLNSFTHLLWFPIDKPHQVCRLSILILVI